MPQQTMFSNYGSGHVGFFGGTIQKTNVPEILQIDCRATDMYRRQDAYPTYLYFNPYAEAKTVEADAGAQQVDVYDTVSRSFLQRGVCGRFRFSIPADAARVLVLVPAGKRLIVERGNLTTGGITIDFGYSR